MSTIPPRIAAALEDMVVSVCRDSTGDLVLGWRIRLWSLMNQAYSEESQFRRDVLAYQVGRQLLSVWELGGLSEECPAERRSARDRPRQGLELSRQFVLGECSREELAGLFRDMISDHEYISPYYSNERSSLAYHGICSLLPRFLRRDDDVYGEKGWYNRVWIDDEHLLINDGALDDPTADGEIHVWAAEAACQEIPPGGELVHVRQFWKDWAKETVPRVLAPIAQVRTIVE